MPPLWVWSLGEKGGHPGLGLYEPWKEEAKVVVERVIFSNGEQRQRFV